MHKVIVDGTRRTYVCFVLPTYWLLKLQIHNNMVTTVTEKQLIHTHCGPTYWFLFSYSHVCSLHIADLFINSHSLYIHDYHSVFSFKEAKRWPIVSCLKELRHGWRILKKWCHFFQVRHSQSVSIFSILNHPCFCLVYYHLFGVFLT